MIRNVFPFQMSIWVIFIDIYSYYLMICAIMCYLFEPPVVILVIYNVWKAHHFVQISQVGGGGHVEDALVDLTGGVAGRFYTADVTRTTQEMWERKDGITLKTCRGDGWWLQKNEF